MANTTEVTKEIFFKICDFLEKMYGDRIKKIEYLQMWEKVLQCINNNNYILSLDNQGNIITYAGWYTFGDTIWIEDCCILDKKDSMKNLIKELKQRYRNKGFKYIKYLHRCEKLVTLNIERYTKHESF